MTNHIEELMKAAGVEKQYYSFKSADGNTYNWELNENGNEKYKKYFIGEPELKERTFTPAKQLELIKLISIGNGINYHFDLHKYKLLDKWEFTSYVNTGGTKVEHTNFEQGLVELVLRMISKGHIDKSEVKRILEDE